MIAPRLLGWYDAHHRDLPWRITPAQARAGILADPYHVWLSEVMLQQTTVEAVKPYFARFLEIWPDVQALAAADQDDVMKAWAGLGYYSRARNLKKCATIIAQKHGGRFPDDETQLRALPGIGPYTAAAIAAIAFNSPAAVVDGNVERVISRLCAIATPMPAAKSEIRIRTASITPLERPGDFAQAMMDLGASLCSPKRPKCIACPLNENCAALVEGDPELYPVKPPKMQRPSRQGAAFIAVSRDGAVLLRKRPAKGLLASMSEPPTSNWNSRLDGETGIEAAPFDADWQPAGAITHVFTHFELTLSVWLAKNLDLAAPDGWWWSPPHALIDEALPTVMKKAIAAALPDAFSPKRRRS